MRGDVRGSEVEAMAYVSLSPPAPRMIVLFAWSTRDLLNGAVASQGKKPAVGTMYTISGDDAESGTW